MTKKLINLTELLQRNFESYEVSPIDFYRDIFPQGSFEKKGVYETGKYNGIAVSVGVGDTSTKRFTVTDELSVISSLVASDDFCIMSPISYAGKARTSTNARFLYALAIDLDGVDTITRFEFLLQQFENGLAWHKGIWGLPTPTYIVSSGTGLHLYYVFERAIPLFKNIVKQLEVLKHRLTWQAWTQGASSLHDSVQYESLFQGFRMVGTITKVNTRVRAFKIGKKTTIEELNRYVPNEYQVTDFVYKSDLRLEEAKKLYPEWYQKRIVEKQPKGSWTCKRALYDWWIRKIHEKIEQGHRYWGVMTLATYAVKCGIPQEELERDAYGLIPFLNSIGDPFTEDDVMHALEAFTESYRTYPIHTIVTRTGVPIEKNKRNGQRQEFHLEEARAIRDIRQKRSNANWWDNGNRAGAPTKKELIQTYAHNHPSASQREIAKALGVSPTTVNKWLKKPC